MTDDVAIAPAPPRIKTLTLKDFRAFGGPEPFVFELAGKNLLVYGENGSGKSSIFHALDELFSIRLNSPYERRTLLASLRNRFSGLGPDEGFVEVTFVDGLAPALWDNSRHPADVDPASNARVVNAAYRKAILDYRSLLETNYRFPSGSVNLFDVCVRVLLRDYPVLRDGAPQRLLDLWRHLESFLGRKQLRAREVAEINSLAVSFNEGLRNALDELLPRVGPLLADLGCDDMVLVAINMPGVTYNGAKTIKARAFDGRVAAPELIFRAQPILMPQTFLNEARLSALALAIYFAGRQVCAATLQRDTPRLMVLDDVLIGLDQSNRMPVLKLVQKHFADWQIVLLTYDRVWYEMAKFYLADRATWSALEIFEETEPSGGSRPVLRPENIDPVATNIAKARKFQDSHEYSAAAVHARVAFESSLKKFANRNSIPVRFRLDPKRLSTEDLLSAIEIWLKHPERAGKQVILDPLMATVKLWRNVVLNPFSHSTPVGLTATEVSGAIDAVEALHAGFSAAVKMGGGS